MTKNQIIREIQRTAKENGGKPLGRLRFLGETGIKESDWRGKYWGDGTTRFKTLGLVPISFSTPSNDGLLLENFAVLVRELGRVPTVSEWQLKRSDQKFPNSKVLERFGSKE